MGRNSEDRPGGEGAGWWWSSRKRSWNCGSGSHVISNYRVVTVTLVTAGRPVPAELAESLALTGGRLRARARDTPAIYIQEREHTPVNSKT